MNQVVVRSPEIKDMNLKAGDLVHVHVKDRGLGWCLISSTGAFISIHDGSTHYKEDVLDIKDHLKESTFKFVIEGCKER